MDELLDDSATHPHLNLILRTIDTIVAGPFEQDKRDISLPYRGSSNQSIWTLDHEKNIWYNKNDNKSGRIFSNVRTRENE